MVAAWALLTLLFVSGVAATEAPLGEELVAVDSVGDAPWWTFEQRSIGSFRPPEARWRQLVRAPGPWGYALLLSAPLLLLWTRKRRRDPVMLVFIGGCLSLTIASGVLLARVLDKALPPPPVLRGVVQRAANPVPAGSVGLYAWGESTMHGDVWGPALSIPRVVGWALRDRVGGAPLVVQNLAEPGTSLSRGFPASLEPIFRDKERYRPAAVLIYVGHNEYYNLRGRRLSRADAKLRVERDTEAHLRQLGRLSAEASVPVFVALPASNVEGHPPMEPDHPEGVSEPARGSYEAALDQAESALRQRRWKAAETALDSAQQLSPEHAWQWYLRGRLLRATGRAQEARGAFRRSVSLDFNRQRASAAHRALIQRVCDETALHCVDAEEALRSRCPWFDDACFIDLHHPVAAGHILIGEAFAAAVARTLGEPAPQKMNLKTPPQHLEPRSATLERLVQTAGWYLVLATELSEGYPRARRAALSRAQANVSALRAAESKLSPDAAGRVSAVAPLLELLVSAVGGDAAETAKRWQRLRSSYDWSDGRHPIPERWMRQVIEGVLGPGSLERGPQGAER